MHPILGKCFFLSHNNEEVFTINFLLLELNKAISGPINILNGFLISLFLIGDQQIKLIGGSDQVKGYVLLVGKLKIEV